MLKGLESGPCSEFGGFPSAVIHLNCCVIGKNNNDDDNNNNDDVGNGSRSRSFARICWMVIILSLS